MPFDRNRFRNKIFIEEWFRVMISSFVLMGGYESVVITVEVLKSRKNILKFLFEHFRHHVESYVTTKVELFARWCS